MAWPIHSVMEVLLEFEGSRRVVHLNGVEVGVRERLEEEIRKFGDEEINSCLESGKKYNLKKWSDKWKCYIDVDEDSILDLKDGDRIAIGKKCEVEVSLNGLRIHSTV